MELLIDQKEVSPTGQCLICNCKILHSQNASQTCGPWTHKLCKIFIRTRATCTSNIFFTTYGRLNAIYGIICYVFKASPRRQGGGGSPYLRSRLSPPRRRLGDKAVVDRLASPYRFKNIDNLKGNNFHIGFFSSKTLKLARAPLGKKTLLLTMLDLDHR